MGRPALSLGRLNIGTLNVSAKILAAKVFAPRGLAAAPQVSTSCEEEPLQYRMNCRGYHAKTVLTPGGGAAMRAAA